jgi:hypothetical protein
MTEAETEAALAALKVRPAAPAASAPDTESYDELTKVKGVLQRKENVSSGLPERLISVKLSDERKFTPEEWQDILTRIENGEVALENEKNGNFTGFTESGQIINVDVKSLNAGEYVCLGQYTLQKGDMIKYNITAETDGILNVGFSKTADPSDNNQYLGHTGLAGNSVIIANFPVQFKNALSGTYYLWIGYAQFETLDDIKGTVEIAAE